ncbi:MAG: HAD family phosphatase [Acidimicrobiaceae bacterium]|nr:HAD family phosphatase [Acidimicrobiaceae bacterium]
MPIRLIASDLDGTLFGPDHKPAPRTAAAVNAARDAGILVVAATGRSHFGGAAMATCTGAAFDWFIGSNGGHRLNMATGAIEERLVFESEPAHKFRASVLSQFEDAGFGWELEDRLVYDENFLNLSRYTMDGAARTSQVGDHTSLNGIGKMFVIHPEIPSTALIAHVIEHAHPEHNVASSGTDFVEITPSGADKGAALARLCAELGITADEVIAFGDNNNDLTMLNWAGRSVAMANAVDEAKEIADELTASNSEFGVAQVIESLLAP